MYLGKLENEKDTLIYLKSRRFRKSLFTSMLSYYYDVNMESEFETLFKGLYEYDNFTNGILEGDTSLFKSVVDKNVFVKSFYAIIKEYIGLGIIDRFFATGICPIMLNSMTTGFNIAIDISTSSEYNSMVGLTHEEVKGLLKELELTSVEQDNIFDVMLKNYDGYKFSKHTEERVLNATLVMYFLSKYMDNKKIPDVLYDNNIVVNYDKIDNLFKLQGNSFYKELISDILDNDEIEVILETQFNLAEDFARDDILSLLYYFGYLTIKEMNIIGKIVFRIPNYIMKETYGNYFLKILRNINIQVDTKVQDNGMYADIYKWKIKTPYV